MIGLAVLSVLAASSCLAPIPDTHGWRQPPACRHELSREEFNIVCRTVRSRAPDRNQSADLPCTSMENLDFVNAEAGTEVQFYVKGSPSYGPLY